MLVAEVGKRIKGQKRELSHLFLIHSWVAADLEPSNNFPLLLRKILFLSVSACLSTHQTLDSFLPGYKMEST